MCVAKKHGRTIARIELADLAWLFLREQQAAVRGADDAVRVVGALPRDRPRRSGRDDAGNGGDEDVTRALRLAGAALRDEELTGNEQQQRNPDGGSPSHGVDSNAL